MSFQVGDKVRFKKSLIESYSWAKEGVFEIIEEAENRRYRSVEGPLNKGIHFKLDTGQDDHPKWFHKDHLELAEGQLGLPFTWRTK